MMEQPTTLGTLNLNRQDTRSSSNDKLCRFFQLGNCKFGPNCFYSHSNTQIEAQVNPKICRYFLQGNCMYGNQCLFDHVLPNQTSNHLTTTSTHQSTSEKKSTAKSEDNNNNSNVKQSPVVRVLNKQKLIPMNTTNNSNESVSCKPNESKEISSPNTYYEALTGNKSIATQNGDVPPDMFDESFQEYLKLKANASSADPSKTSLCPYFEKSMICPFGENCIYSHGDICDICCMPCLHPFNEELRAQHRVECTKLVEEEMEAAFAEQRSVDKVCGICMEVVWEKESSKLGDKRFGLLENCNHVFCLPCIRKWRESKSYENKIVKACPECRVTSDYVTPSKYWFENEEQKKKIISDYKANLNKTSCKYFKQGDGHCPFGSKCFYEHKRKDGTLATLPDPSRRRRYNRSGNLERFSNIIRIDFDFEDDNLDDNLDMDLLTLLREAIINSYHNDDEELAELFNDSDFF